MRGERFLDPTLEETMHKYKLLQTSLSAESSILEDEMPELTPRELDVLHMFASGMWQTDELSDRLAITKNTANVHFRSIFAKLKVKNRMEAVEKARLLGLIKGGN